jgi:hypothetical protein
MPMRAKAPIFQLKAPVVAIASRRHPEQYPAVATKVSTSSTAAPLVGAKAPPASVFAPRYATGLRLFCSGWRR